MKPGELTASGTLFMRGSVYPQRTSTGEVQYLFPLIERRGLGVQNVTGVWSGVEAETFVNSLGATLKAGAPLSITFRRLFVHNNELHGVIYSASLAPGRWEAVNTKPAAASAAPVPQPETTT